MNTHLRIARPVSDLERSVAQYRAGLGPDLVGRFADHDGFDGAMLGVAGAGHHFEFTCARAHRVLPAPTPEALLVFYVPQQAPWETHCRAMRDAGFREVEPLNPC